MFFFKKSPRAQKCITSTTWTTLATPVLPDTLKTLMIRCSKFNTILCKEIQSFVCKSKMYNYPEPNHHINLFIFTLLNIQCIHRPRRCFPLGQHELKKGPDCSSPRTRTGIFDFKVIRISGMYCLIGKR